MQWHRHILGITISLRPNIEDSARKSLSPGGVWYAVFIFVTFLAMMAKNCASTLLLYYDILSVPNSGESTPT